MLYPYFYPLAKFFAILSGKMCFFPMSEFSCRNRRCDQSAIFAVRQLNAILARSSEAGEGRFNLATILPTATARDNSYGVGLRNSPFDAFYTAFYTGETFSAHFG